VPHAASAHTAHECRQCCSFCDRLVHPAGCLAAGCQYLYVFDDEHTGARYMGCLHKVFKGEIDMELFDQAQRTRHGFGGVKLTGDPLPQCKVTVERAYDGYGDAFDCVNPGFLQAPETRDDPFGSFDLRNGL
jgi:hypothetical protein